MKNWTKFNHRARARAGAGARSRCALWLIYNNEDIVNEIEAFVILAAIPGLGSIKIRFLIDYFGSAANALTTPSTEIGKLEGFEKIVPYWNRWQKNPEWQRDLEIVNKHHVKLIPFNSPQYPKRLLEIPDYPILLYVQGELKPQDQRSIAIVGTRQASIYGNEMASSISKDLASQGFTIISGLARGIDTAAHCGALETGRTVAVIGSGLANIYPSENIPLANAICRQGALISEFPMSTAPDRQNFPQRNRIVSGMTLATLLIEAPIKSGAMITVDRAKSQNRKIFALPGRVDNENFRGNHFLIKNGQAYLIESAQDIIAHFQDLFSFTSIKAPIENTRHLDAEELHLMNKMPEAELNIDELAIASALPIQHVQRVLMSLVLKKMVKEYPGKIYKKRSHPSCS